jgi:hypothetical protein
MRVAVTSLGALLTNEAQPCPCNLTTYQVVRHGFTSFVNKKGRIAAALFEIA